MRKYDALRHVKPEHAERLRKAMILIVASYSAKSARQRAAAYVSRDV